MDYENFCRDWHFARMDATGAQSREFDHQNWEPVILPHSWNVGDMGPGLPPDQAYVGPAWYRKRFSCPAPKKEERVFLLFESAANFSEVWVNGNFVGGRDGGFLSFRLDITQTLGQSSDGEHVVAVRVDNAFRLGSMPPRQTDWDRYGGIYRPVWLCRSGGAHFDHKGIQIRTPQVSVDKATVTITSAIWEKAKRSRNATLRHRILDPDGKEAGRWDQSIATRYARSVCDSISVSLENPRLWSVDGPQCYRVESSLLEGEEILDSVVNPLGLRWFSFDSDTGFSLNGENMKLRGVCVHEQFPGLGSALPERFFREEFEQMRACGINYIRGSHYPRNERALELCDELGIMVMEEQPYWHGSMRAFHGEALVSNARRTLRDLVRHHGNHPCIIAWNTVNEVMLANPNEWEPHPDPSQRTDEHLLPQHEWPFAVRCISEMHDELHCEDSERVTSAIIGGAWAKNLEAGIDKICDLVGLNGGAFHAMVEEKPLYDYLRERDPQCLMIATEGIINDSDAQHERADWEKEATAWQRYALHWSRIYERPWLPGGSMWVYEDYSAQGRYRPMGIVDITLLPHEGWHFFRSLWTQPLMAHICGHWSYPGTEGTEREVVVFTSGDLVELRLNGELLDRREPERNAWPSLPHPPVVFKIPYRPGKLVATAQRNNEVVQDSRRTEATPAKIVLSTNSHEVLADGQDAAFITATVADAHGNRCYRFNGEMTAEVEGPGRIASWGGTNRIEVRGGLGRFAVRSTGSSGILEISGGMKGLTSGNISVKAG